MGSIVKPSLVLEERAKGDHMEGVLWQCKQLKHKLREVTMDYMSPAAKEAVARVLGEDLDMQQVLESSTGVSMMEPEMVPRQG